MHIMQTYFLEMKTIIMCFFRSELSIFEAISKGAIVAIKVVVYIVVHLIAFMAIINFIDETLVWFGNRLELEHTQITFSVRKFYHYKNTKHLTYHIHISYCFVWVLNDIYK